MYSCFLFTIQSRVFFHFAWIFGAGGEFIFMSAGGMNIFVPSRATYEPRPPLHRGYPLPLLPPVLSRQTAAKKYPRPSFFIYSPSPVSACWIRPAPHRFRLLPRCCWLLFR